MLSHEEQEEITQELSRYEKKSAACIEALRVVQRHRGWVSDQAIGEIAEFLSLTPADVDGVATFYNLIFRKPVGRHVIFFCDSVSCWVMGAEPLKDQLCRRLGIQPGETTADGAITLLPIVCLGHCGAAPALLVDGEIFRCADTSSLDRLLEGIASEGRK